MEQSINLEKNIENMTLKENENKNIKVILKEYKIISNYFEDNEEEEENEINDYKSKDFFLPTPESIKKMCDCELVKNFINFDFDKFKSNFKEKSNDNNINSKKVINLDNIPYIQNSTIVSLLLIFLGGINSLNSIYDFFDDSILSPNEECNIDNNNNYLDYLNSVMDYLKQEEQNDNLYFNYNDLELLLKSLYELGINIIKSDTNILYRNIKDSFFSMEKNRILVLVAPSNIFWIKSEHSDIGNKTYDRHLNNKANIFYNTNFFKKFYSKIANHSRCKVGFISSMCVKNLKTCYDGLNILVNNNNSENPILISQDYHDKDEEVFFRRNMKKIIKYLKKKNYNFFDEKKIIIIESEKDKIGNNTKNNSIFVNLFNEEIIKSNEKMKQTIEASEDKTIKYIMDLLENCSDDIRKYINENNFD